MSTHDASTTTPPPPPPRAGPTGFQGDFRGQVGSARFWAEAQDSGRSLWNLATPTPVFVGLLDSPTAPAPGRMVVPGFGMGHDALLFARRGFRVVGFDFADYAVPAATAAAARQGIPPDRAGFYAADIFALGPEWDGGFDYALEYTCFCAIDPARRPEYARLLHRLLRPGGELLALFFPLADKPGGPPFAVREDEIRSLFGGLGFEVTAWQNRPALSVPQRAVGEAFVRMTKTAAGRD
jgi:SAM-dependent methyltransferase